MTAGTPRRRPMVSVELPDGWTIETPEPGRAGYALTVARLAAGWLLWTLWRIVHYLVTEVAVFVVIAVFWVTFGAIAAAVLFVAYIAYLLVATGPHF